jgi:hypothetical protein
MKMADTNTSNINVLSAETAKPAVRCYFPRFTVRHSLTLSAVGIARVCIYRKMSTNTVPAEFILRTSISAALIALTISLLVCLLAVLHLKNTSLAFAVKCMWKPYSEIPNTATCVICTDLTEHLQISNQCTFYPKRPTFVYYFTFWFSYRRLWAFKWQRLLTYRAPTHDNAHRRHTTLTSTMQTGFSHTLHSKWFFAIKKPFVDVRIVLYMQRIYHEFERPSIVFILYSFWISNSEENPTPQTYTLRLYIA